MKTFWKSQFTYIISIKSTYRTSIVDDIVGMSWVTFSSELMLTEASQTKSVLLVVTSVIVVCDNSVTEEGYFLQKEIRF